MSDTKSITNTALELITTYARRFGELEGVLSILLLDCWTAEEMTEMRAKARLILEKKAGAL